MYFIAPNDVYRTKGIACNFLETFSRVSVIPTPTLRSDNSPSCR